MYRSLGRVHDHDRSRSSDCHISRTTYVQAVCGPRTAARLRPSAICNHCGPRSFYCMVYEGRLSEIYSRVHTRIAKGFRGMIQSVDRSNLDHSEVGTEAYLGPWR